MSTDKTGPTPQPGILDIAPYKGGAAKIDGVTDPIKLSANEGAFGPSPKAIRVLKDVADGGLHRYPDGHATRLRSAIAAHHGIAAEQIVCGAGSDEILHLLTQAYAGEGDEVVHTAHGFLVYKIAAQGVGAAPVSVPETDLKADVGALLAHVTPATKMMFLANPNNPTGTYLTRNELADLRAGLRDDILLVIDGAYAEYVDAADYSDGFELVAGGNTVATRTFSKIYGLGGLRLGWGYCPASVADVLNRIRPPFNVSSLAVDAGIAALEDQTFIAESQAHNLEWRMRTAGRLRQLGLDVPDGVGNFVLIRFDADGPRTAEAADAFLQARGIIARRVAAYGLPTCLRLTIGRPGEMERVFEAFDAFMGATDT